jgi:hypothetical protein
MNSMTHHEALQQAQRRWGEAGRVRHRPGELESDRFRVGKQIGSVFWVKGVGSSWDEAFLTADRNAQNQP